MAAKRTPKGMDQKELRKAKNREARAKLKEVKRWVTDPVRGDYLKSFYGPTLEAAEQAWRDLVNPPLQEITPEVGENLAESPVLPNSVAWWYLHKYKPTKDHLRKNTRAATQHAATHLLPEVWTTMIWDFKTEVLIAALNRIAEKKTLRNHRAKAKPVEQPDGTVAYVLPPPKLEPLSASLINKCRRLGLELNELAYEELGNSNDKRRVSKINAKRIPVRKEKKRDVTIYTPPMIRLLIEASGGRTCYIPVILCGIFGLRINEALGFNVEDLVGTELHVRYQQTDTLERTDELKTDNSARDLPVPAPVMDLLRPFAFGKALRLARGNADNNPISEGNCNRSIKLACGRAGLPVITAHELRHAFATWLEENGCPRSVRFDLLGHSAEGIGERYVHPSMVVKRQWITRFWKAMQKPYVGPVVAPAAREKLGTRTPSKGEANGRAVLTAEIVSGIIRPRLKLGDTPYRIAKDLEAATGIKVDRNAIRQIQLGKTWKEAV